MVRVGRARTFGTGGTFFQATIGPGAAYNFRRTLREKQFDLLNIHGPCDVGLAFWALSMFRGPKVLTLHNASLSRRALAPPDCALLPLGVSAGRRGHCGLGGDRAVDGALCRLPIDHHPERHRRGRTGGRRRAPGISGRGCETSSISAASSSATGPRSRSTRSPGSRQSMPDVRLLMAGDGPMRAELEAQVAPDACATASNSWARSTTSVPSCSRRRRCSCCRRGRWGSPSWCWRRSRPVCRWWRCRRSGTDRAGDHWVERDRWPRTTAAPRVRRRRDRYACSATRASASRAGGSIADAFDWEQDRQADPRRLPARRWDSRRSCGPAPEGRGVTLDRAPAQTSRLPRRPLEGRSPLPARSACWRVVLWREKPWTVTLAANAPWAVAAAILLNLSVSLPLKAARWRLALIDPPPFRQVLAATIEGLLANAAIGFGSGDLVRAARLRGPGVAPDERSKQLPSRQLAADYACTWAERGAEVLALAILVVRHRAADEPRHAGPGLLGAGHRWDTPRCSRGGRYLVPRLGRWPRVAARAVVGLAGLHAAPGGGHGGAVAARVVDGDRDAGAVPGRLSPRRPASGPRC